MVFFSFFSSRLLIAVEQERDTRLDPSHTIIQQIFIESTGGTVLNTILNILVVFQVCERT